MNVLRLIRGFVSRGELHNIMIHRTRARTVPARAKGKLRVERHSSLSPKRRIGVPVSPDSDPCLVIDVWSRLTHSEEAWTGLNVNDAVGTACS